MLTTRFNLLTSIFATLTATLVIHSVVPADAPKTIRDYAAEYPRRANVNIPEQPLQPEDIDRWAKILGASEAQRKYMFHEYRHFVDRHNAYLARQAPEYLSMSAQLSELLRSGGLSSPDAAELSRRLDEFSKLIRQTLTSHERTYINALKPVFHPGQHDRFVLLQHDATRRNCRTFFSHARWVHVELRPVWLRSAEHLASSSEREQVGKILDEYELQLTPLICRQSNLQFERREQLWENRIARASGKLSPGEARERYEQLMSSSINLVQRIRKLHERTIDRITQVLPHQVAQVFIAEAKHIAFPELYPDPFELNALFAMIEKDEEISEEMELTVAALSASYRADYDRVCDELESMCIEWGEKIESGHVNDYLPQHLPPALKPRLGERQNLSRRHFEKLVEHLGPEVLARHAEAVPAALEAAFTDLVED